uniref:GH39 family glycosyl hydrolase n=1 Tax=Pararhizobium sp. IMCC3301 TaxID=3067904 RepID=UPI002741F0E8|nr:glycosyl hydrolase [Pararhizobium sp. IMCC3301]
MSASFKVDCGSPTTPFPHYWETVVGSGHAPLALRADWQAHLRHCQQDLGFRYVRFHGILSDDMGTLIDQNDQLLYSFHNADTIFDFLMSIGMKPFVELSFMPLALSSGGEIVFHYKGNISPPRDFGQWETLISKLVGHWVERYGLKEVSSWFFEVWNEPNLDAFWTGSQADYFKLYATTARAVKGVNESLRVGGPATAASEWVDAFVEFCRKHKVPYDFVSTHHYPTDAFGDPGDDTLTQLSKSRIGVLNEQVAVAHRQAGGAPLYYTEWCTSSNSRDTLHDDPYAAAYIVKTIMDMGNLVEGYSYWTFTDIFEENYFPSLPFHGGFGLTNIHGIPKPAYRGYQLMHALGDRQHAVEGNHHTVSVWVISRKDRTTVLITNLALPRHDIEQVGVSVVLKDLAPSRAAWIARIDDSNANAKACWEAMKKIDYPIPDQVAQMMKASELQWTEQQLDLEDGAQILNFMVQPQSVTAIELHHSELQN